MRKLITAQLVTLDGVMQDPGGFGELPHGGWSHQHFDDEAVQQSIDLHRGCDLFLCGRVTYELLSKAWSGNTGEYPDLVNSSPKLVASTTFSEPLEWNASLIKGDVVEEISRIKQEPGKNIVLYGSATLLRTLLRHDLVDEIQTWVFPLIVGGGKRLFADYVPRAFELIDTKQLTSGMVIHSYRPVRGPVKEA
ncbi:dihydrofolate reductase family protein [Pseudonocardia spinosispora]|uniref:dihydrofolate reductase family protein n=1 Tax=Pseudonocardia spinosispora TaxID=103441 RepID=UPI00041179DC|nr:dihydrofolate reductase family protein [Pseudonocardia spinosispora]